MHLSLKTILVVVVGLASVPKPLPAENNPSGPTPALAPPEVPVPAEIPVPAQEPTSPPVVAEVTPQPPEAPTPDVTTATATDAPPAENPAPTDSGPTAPSSDSATGPTTNNSESGATFQTFYDALADQGTWIQTKDYGYVWQPQVDDPNWAPYTLGHWVYTDDGWTWASDEPFGWATYHYGRWVNLDQVGWCWVPGYTWAPAWVSWRYGEDYSGWAPLPPDSLVGIDYIEADTTVGEGFHIGGDCDAYYYIGAGCYRFIPTNCLGHPHYRDDYVRCSDNYSIINRTTNVTNINCDRNEMGGGNSGINGKHPSHNFVHVTMEGPSLAQVNAINSTPVEKVHVLRSHDRDGGKLNGHSLSIYRPRLSSDPAHLTHPARVDRNVDETSINHGVDITKPLAVNSHLAPTAPSDIEVRRAQIAQERAPVRAKVASPSAPSQPVLRTPLTSLQPTPLPSTARVQNSYTPGISSPTYNQSRGLPTSPGGFAPSRTEPTRPNNPAESLTPQHPMPHTMAPESPYHAPHSIAPPASVAPAQVQRSVPMPAPAPAPTTSSSAGGNTSTRQNH